MKWLGFATIGLVLVPFFVNNRGKAVGSAPYRAPVSHHSPSTHPSPKTTTQKAQLEQAQLQLLLYQAGIRNQTIVLNPQTRTDAVAVSKK